MAHRKNTAAARRAAPETSNGKEAVVASVVASVTDLEELFENESAIITLYDPRDEFMKEKRDTGFRIEIGPLWSPEAREIATKNKDRIRLVADGTPDLQDPAVDDSILEQVIGVTKRWWHEPDNPDGIVLRGEFLACTPANVRAVYTNPKLAGLYAQVRNGFLDRARFFGVPPKTA